MSIKILICLALTALTAAPNLLLAQTGSSPTPIRVMSFNVRQGVASDGANHWNKRKQFVTQTIESFGADIVGTQETWDFQADYIRQQLSEYDYVGRSRQAGGKRGEQCGIFFRASRFEKLIEGHFWLSQSPDRPGSKSWDSSLPRMATWLKLWDRENKRSFYILNTHFDHRGSVARTEGAKLIRQFVSELKQPVNLIVTGDFNVGEGSGPYQALFSDSGSATKLIDTFRLHHPDRSSTEGTFNQFRGTNTGGRIDWIGVTPSFKIESANIDTTQFGDRYPSDHFPVTAVLEFGPKLKLKTKRH